MLNKKFKLNSNGIFKKQDLIVLAIFILALIASIVLLTLPKGETVEIYLDGELYAIYDLNKDYGEIVIEGVGSNTVKIEGGKVKVTDASCPDKLCTTSTISRVGSRIICAPNRLLIIIKGKSEIKAITGGNG